MEHTTSTTGRDLWSEESYIPISLSRAGMWCSPHYRSLSLSATERPIQPDEGLNIWGKSNSIRGKLVLRNGSGRLIAKLYKNPTSSVAASFGIYTESPQHAGQRSCKEKRKGTILFKWAEVVADPHARNFTLCEANKCNVCVPRFWATTTLDGEVHIRSEHEPKVAIMARDETKENDSAVYWKVLVNPSAWKDIKLVFCFMSIIDEMKENHSIGNMTRCNSTGADLVSLDKILVSACRRRTLSLSEQLAAPAPSEDQENVSGEQNIQSKFQLGNRRSSSLRDWSYKRTSVDSSGSL